MARKDPIPDQNLRRLPEDVLQQVRSLYDDADALDKEINATKLRLKALKSQKDDTLDQVEKLVREATEPNLFNPIPPDSGNGLGLN